MISLHSHLLPFFSEVKIRLVSFQVHPQTHTHICVLLYINAAIETIWYLIKHIYMPTFSPYSMIFCVRAWTDPFNCFIVSFLWYGYTSAICQWSLLCLPPAGYTEVETLGWIETSKSPSNMAVPHSHLFLIFSIFLFRTLYLDPLFFGSLSLVIFLGRDRKGGFIKTER